MSRRLDPQAAIVAIEAAMVRVRRRQTRRALASPTPIDAALVAVIDALEATDPLDEPTVGRIAEQLGVDQSQGSRLVTAAVTAGLVERVASPTDGRRCLLRLTPGGRRTAAVVHRSRQAAFAKATHTWTDSERATFADLLTRFVDALDATDTPGGPS